MTVPCLAASGRLAPARHRLAGLCIESCMSAKKWAVVALLLGLGGVCAAIVFHYVPLHDFVEYWATAHALVNRQNPYSIETIRKLQQALGWNEEQPLVLMSPPHFLPFLIPLGFMHSYVLARLLWLCLSVGMLVVAISTLWSLYGGNPDRRWIGVSVAALFFPVWHCLAVAQIGPLLLLGVVGFLRFEQRGRLFLAGSSLALTTFKPHLFYLVWLALFLWSVKSRDVRVIAGAGVSVCTAIAAALIVDPAALSQYRAVMTSDYIWGYTSGAGGALRLLLEENNHLLQFAPTLPGIIALAWYWRRYRKDWQWRERLPVVLTLSILTAAYGWPFDEVVLLVAVVMIAVQCTDNAFMRRSALVWLIGNFAASLLVVLRYGDAGGMTVCAAGVLTYLIFAARCKNQGNSVSV